MATDLRELNRFRNRLKNLGSTSRQFANEVVDELVKKGADIATQKYAGVDGVNVSYETNGSGQGRIIAEGEQVAYIEFGTGRVGQYSNYDRRFLPDKNVPITGYWEYYYDSPYKRRGHSDGKTKADRGWWHKFEGEEKARFTTGQEAGMQMYHTRQELIAQSKAIIQNKLEGDDKNV